MHAPYQNFEKMDMGLRRMVWGNYKTNSLLFSLFGSSPYQIIVLQSSLGFYNVIVSLTTDAEPDILGIMPFLAEPNAACFERRNKKTNKMLQHQCEFINVYDRKRTS